MANPITGAYQAQQTAAINQTTQTRTTNKPTNQMADPHDTVTISQAGQAASQAHQAGQTHQAAKPVNDGDHDGS